MKNLVLVILAVCTLVPRMALAEAKSAKKKKPLIVTQENFPELLTAAQLLALPPTTRMAYMKTIREMLVELSRMSAKKKNGFAADNQWFNLQKRLEQLASLILPEAYALTCPPEYPYNFNNLICGRLYTNKPETNHRPGEVGQADLGGSGGYFYFRSEDYNRLSDTQRRGMTISEVDQARVRGTLPPVNGSSAEHREQYLKRAADLKANEYQTRELQEEADRIAAEYRNLKEKMRTVDDKNVTSETERTEARETAAALARRADALKERAAYLDAPGDDAATAQQRKLSASLQGIDKSETESTRRLAELKTPEEYNLATGIANIQKHTAEMKDKLDKLPAPGTEVAKDPKKDGSLVPTGAKPETAEEKAVREKREQEIKEVQQLVQDIQEKKRSAYGATCQQMKLQCENENIAGYRKEHRDKQLEAYRAQKIKNCISAGNMSEYAGEIKAGNCAKVREFCITGDCKKPPEKVKGFLTKYSCPNGQVICPPLVFGLERMDKAICVQEKGRNLTEACDKSRETLGKKPGFVADLINQGPPGVSNAWDTYAKDFNKNCKEHEGSMSAQCEECALIGRRLAEAKYLATGTCNNALAASQIKPGEISDDPAAAH